MSDKFTFIDLFAGIGGFHAALAGLGGRCVYVAEKDRHAQAVYKKAWLSGDEGEPHVTSDINDDVPLDAGHTIAELLRRAQAGEIKLQNIPEDFDVLTAGFPCQAFSKSGKQEGILDTVRGTLFYNILVIVAMRRPGIVFLENVKNLVGPAHRETTFRTIIDSLAELGYVVNADPTIFSPHTIAPGHGGGPQNRERVYILAVREDLVLSREPFVDPKRSEGWSADKWQIDWTPLPALGGVPAVITDRWVAAVRCRNPEVAEYAEQIRSSYLRDLSGYRLNDEDKWFGVYERLVANVVTQRMKGSRGSWFPGHPIWFDAADEQWLESERIDAEAHRGMGSKARDWKDEFLDKSLAFIKSYSKQLRGRSSGDVLRRIRALPNNAWRKFEWQASDAESLDECLIQLRPSGVRVKKATYTPALVAINQAPILGSERRRLTPYEAGRLQGFPDLVYDAMLETKQPEGQSYKQFGNAVHVGTVQFALVNFVCHHFGIGEVSDAADLGRLVSLVQSCRSVQQGWSQKPPRVEPAARELVVPGEMSESADEPVPPLGTLHASVALH